MSNATDNGSFHLKPNKPETYDGRRDYLTVSTLMYTLEQYLNLSQINSPNVSLPEGSKIAFASSYMKGAAAVWWFNIVTAGNVPATWEQFKASVNTEFIPLDHVKRSRDRLRRLRQLHSVSKYLSEFRNLILAIPGMSEGEKLDRFIEGLKYPVRVEVLKTHSDSFEECARIALNVDSAIWRASSGSRADGAQGNRGSTSNSMPTPMEVGNTEGSKRSRNQTEQRKRDIERGACFTCHQVGCRPWKHRAPAVNNVDSKNTDETIESDSDTESEN